MPLFKRLQPGKDIDIAIWHITESHESLRKLLPEGNLELFVHEMRNLHWLGARMALYTLTGQPPAALVKDGKGKPHLKDGSAWISLSHSGDFAAAAVCRHPVGIDVEHIHPRLLRVKEKFISEPEKSLLPVNDELPWLAMVWSAKESLFKVFAEKAVDFKQQQQVTTLNDTGISMLLKELDPPLEIEVPALRLSPDYLITWTVCDNGHNFHTGK